MNLIKLYKNINPTVKGTIWFTFAILLQKGLSSLTTPIITRLLSMEDYGTYSMYQTWYSIFLIICTFNLSGSIFNTLMIDNENKQDKVSNSVIGFECVVTIFVFLIYLVLSSFFDLLSGINRYQGILIFLNIIAMIPQSIWIAKMKYKNYYKLSSFIICIQSICLIVGNFLAAYLSKGNINALLLSTIIIEFVFSFGTFFFMIKKDLSIFDASIWKYCLIVGFPLVIHYLAQSILNLSDRIFINNYFGKEATAIYSLAHSISFVLQILITAINAAFMPWLYKRIKSKNNYKVNDSSVLILILFIIFIMVVSLLGPEIIYLFGGSEYLIGASLIPPLSSSILILLVYNYYSAIEFAYGETKVAALATIISAVVNIILNFIFIPYFGYIAAAYTTLFSYFVMLLIHYIYSTYVLKKRDNLVRYYNPFIIFGLLFAGILLNLLVSFLYDYNLVRYILCIILFICCLIIFFINKKRLLKLFINNYNNVED